MNPTGATSYRAAIGWVFLLALTSQIATMTSVWGRVFDPSSPGQRPGATQARQKPAGVPHPSPSGEGAKHAKEYVGSKTCRPCHAAIFDSYSRTSMAQTSGPAPVGLVPGAFTHAPSSIAYRVSKDDDHAYLEYRRTDNAAMHGIQPLLYFLGSGKHGRAYLFTLDGYLFQSPINYYSDPGHWDMSPGYQNVREMPLNHAVERSCLFCHTSQVAAPARGTLNRYPSPPFAEDGVSCERCHGPGNAHVAANTGSAAGPAAVAGAARPRRSTTDTQAPMYIPSLSDAAARDSICAQCHLEGDATVAAPGKDLFDFRPGDHLSDFISVFLVRSSSGQTLHPASHFEALAASQCKMKSGDRMSCITCHDPHSQPASPSSNVGAAPFPAGEDANRNSAATYYRAKCLTCHTAPRFASQHHSEQPDCTVCHMPRLRSSDAAHAMLTDHRIPRNPGTDAVRDGAQPRPHTASLEPLAAPAGKSVDVFLGQKNARSLGLAYAQLAETDSSFATQAITQLEQALRDGPRDPDVLTRLAFLYQQSDDTKRAEQLYRDALAAEPLNRVAGANLGVIYAKSGRANDAVQLWSRTFDLNPFLSEIGTNLAVTSCSAGDDATARQRLAQVLHFNPDYRRAQQLLIAMQSHAIVCGKE